MALIASTVLLASIGGASASAAPAPASKRVSATAQANALAYWTPKRMRAAIPVPGPKLTGKAVDAGDIQPTGNARTIAGKAPAGARIATSSSDADGRTPTVGYSYPYPYDRYYVNTNLYPGVWPYMTVGKIFFNQRDKADGIVKSYVCSGSASARNVILTAGHCLHAGGNSAWSTRLGQLWSSNIIFVPAYENGARPYGSFACGFMTVGNPWYFSSDFARDFGFCRTTTIQFLKTLNQAVGWLGFAWNQSRYLHWHEMGYPQASPFNGQWMTQCTSSWAINDGNSGIGSPDPQGVGCDMTGGSSGGPWIWRFLNGDYANSVNSYKYNTMSQAMFGPYFDTLVNQYRCYVGNNGGAFPPTTC